MQKQPNEAHSIATFCKQVGHPFYAFYSTYIFSFIKERYNHPMIFNKLWKSKQKGKPRRLTCI